jgi:hypothetical protein
MLGRDKVDGLLAIPYRLLLGIGLLQFVFVACPEWLRMPAVIKRYDCFAGPHRLDRDHSLIL